MEDNQNTFLFWKGSPISSFQTSLNKPQYPEITSSDSHVLLVQTPWIINKVPESFPSKQNKIDFWDQDHVKLPCSDKSLTEDKKKRWDVIRIAFNSKILTSQQLQEAILAYNKNFAKKWDFVTLKSYFSEVCNKEESTAFFQSLLPKIVELALQLPELVTGGIPLLKQGQTSSVTFSQIQIASLLANAFLCTFPNRNTSVKGTEYFNYPTINFAQLFRHITRIDRTKAVYEKIRCLLHYFNRVTSNAPTGVVTYSRHFVPDNLVPQWKKSSKTLTKLYISSKGCIEDDGFGLHQIDFAHRLIGGFVIEDGNVQEEIRFVICPELILSKLFTECLNDNEAFLVTGCERFSNYRGYGKSFTWDSDYVDETPCDKSGRKYCTVLAIDALSFSRNPQEQFTQIKMDRELKKAYAGFSWGKNPKKKLCGIATGNWGCGVYRGDVEFKSILQMLAAAESGRDLAYFTFGDDRLRDSMHLIHTFLVENNVTVGRIYHLLTQYNEKQLFKSSSVYNFIRTAISDDATS